MRGFFEADFAVISTLLLPVFVYFCCLQTWNITGKRSIFKLFLNANIGTYEYLRNEFCGLYPLFHPASLQ